MHVGGWPKDAEARKAIQALCDDFGWRYEPAKGRSAHGVGTVMCPEPSRDGCRHTVNGTASNTARALWKLAKQCPHGARPDRNHW